MYSDLFSQVYDKFGWNYYPKIFGEQLLQWISRQGISVKKALDIGCGTGILCSILQENGIEAAGMDLSHGMITMAKEKYPEIFFEQGNMISYQPGKKFDLVTSTCDAMNHILEKEDLQKVLENVHSWLEPGGCFLFDLLKEEETEECEPVDLGELDGKNLEFQICRGDAGRVTLKIHVYACEEKENGTDPENGERVSGDGAGDGAGAGMRHPGRRWIHTEEIHERIYAPEELLQMMEKAGFSRVCCTDRLLGEKSARAATWFVMGWK